VFKNSLLKGTFEPERRKETKGGSWKLHNEELHNLTSPNIITMINQRL
jgi:hypothetical protein